jgi:DNA polymerase I-like protein with 3'-5' exonuclease and polymerase domains
MLTLLALQIIDAEMRQRQFRSMLVNTVHDSIATDVYPGELEQIVALQVDIMENLKKWARDYAPHIDLNWLTCALVVDVEIGTHYGNLHAYRPTESGFIDVDDIPF